MSKEKLSVEQLAQKTQEIVNTENSARELACPQNLMQWRKCEELITECSKKLDQDLLIVLRETLEDEKKDLDNRFASFALLYTYYRKNGKIDQMQAIIDAYAQTFSQYYLCDFYKLMALVKVSTIEKYDSIFALLEGEDYKKYDEYPGYMNLYVEICARYYEIYLDKRFQSNMGTDEPCFSKYLAKACEFAEQCCSNKNGQGNYAKLHANRGRIYALMGRYGDAEKAILHAIDLVSETDEMRSLTIASFNAFYQNIPSIAAYDISAKKLSEKASEISQNAKSEIEELKKANEQQLESQKQSFTKEMEKLKMENLRNVSAITAVFSLIISGIQAFANLNDAHSIGRVFSLYASLFFLGIGVIFLTTYLFTRDKKSCKNFGLVLTAIVCVLAIVAFVLCTVLPY